MLRSQCGNIKMLKFYVIGTPIGNMEDITYRAVRILSEVDLILCEDTRVTKNLLNKYGIKKETLSFHSQSKLSKTDKVLELIKEGKIGAGTAYKLVPFGTF